MVPKKEDGTEGSERANTPESHLDTPTPIDPRTQFSSEDAYLTWRTSRDRQCARDPKLVGDEVSGIAAFLPADTD